MKLSQSYLWMLRLQGIYLLTAYLLAYLRTYQEGELINYQELPIKMMYRHNGGEMKRF